MTTHLLRKLAWDANTTHPSKIRASARSVAISFAATGGMASTHIGEHGMSRLCPTSNFGPHSVQRTEAEHA